MSDYRHDPRSTEQIVEAVLTSDPLTINDRNRLLAKVWAEETKKPFETFLKFLLEHSNPHTVFRAAEKIKDNNTLLRNSGIPSEFEEKNIMTGQTNLLNNDVKFIPVTDQSVEIGRVEISNMKDILRGKKFIDGLEEDKKELE